MHHTARNVSGLLGLLILVSSLSAADAQTVQYGQLCSVSADCERNNICSLIVTDDSYQMNHGRAPKFEQTDLKTVRLGVCVQCEDDCDCAVNQYCSVDEEASVPDWKGIITNDNLNPGNGLTDASRIKAKAIALAWEDIKIRSVCKDYSVPSTTCTVPSDEEHLSYNKKELIELSSGNKVQLDNSIRVWPKAAEASFCGKVNHWAPRKHERVIAITGSDASAPLIKDDTQSEALARQLGDNGDSSAPDNLDAFTNREGDAAFCFPDVRYEGSQASPNLAGCDSCLFNDNSASCSGLPDDSCDCEARNDAPVCCYDNDPWWHFGTGLDWSGMVPSNPERRCSYPLEQFPWEEGADQDAWTTYSQSNYASCATACRPGTSLLN
mmetsp:Transcript_20070/g.48451  ORF Transcript_20070/g.48451 Transcript_20070/m.48451 type:complete len:381 (+) Transcript_20070:264-1406(+)